MISTSKKFKNFHIRSCESHSDRVNRINTTELLKIMGVADEYVIIGNGVLKSRVALKELAEARKESQGGDNNGGDRASNSGVKSGARAQVGDNEGDEDVNKTKTPKREPTNRTPTQAAVSAAESPSTTSVSSRVMPNRMVKAGGSTSDLTKSSTPPASPKSNKKK